MLSSRDLSRHWSLSPATIRSYAASGALKSCRVNRSLRFEWASIWALEAGPTPRAAHAERYQTDLLTKHDLAQALGLSVRSIDRLLARGLPTRNVGTNVRLNRCDAAEWLALHAGVDLHILTRKLAVSHKRPHKQRRFVYGTACATGADSTLLTREQCANKPSRGPAAPRRGGRRARAGDPT